MVRRIFAEKRDGFNVAAVGMLADLRDYLKITALERVRILVRYDLEGLGEAELKAAKPVIFSEPPVDLVHDESFPLGSDETAFGIEYLPGQYDQRADSAAQAVQLMTHGEIPIVKCAQIIVLKGVAGRLSDEDVAKIRKYLINPVDSQEASLGKPETLSRKVESPPDVTVLIGLTRATDEELDSRRQELGLAMSREDLIHTRDYFRDTEHRDPTITEIRLLDTYWSDHCRHTTFLTRFGEVTIEDGPYSEPIKAAWHRYLDARSSLYGAESARPQNLMDIAVIGMGGVEDHAAGVRISWVRVIPQLTQRMAEQPGAWVGGIPKVQQDNSVILTPFSDKGRATANDLMSQVKNLFAPVVASTPDDIAPVGFDPGEEPF
ncbi:MAG: hypothetical protein EBU88_09200 [Acidobacteria bacterium]|nr:hypothetical protein [Acidobacteriota bacterium]